jgi:cellulose synthase/poly-beta-1,6-N-acetylglucosamine synthase-like glycosyltransferase
MAVALAESPTLATPRCGAPRSGFRAERETLYTRIGITVTAVAAAMVTLDMSWTIIERAWAGKVQLALEDSLFFLILIFLAYGNLVHQFCRLGYLKRIASHRPVDRSELEAIYDRERAQPVAILVPSYREQLKVVRQTLMSAALTEYPNRRVVLLIDDPPSPGDLAAAADLAATRRLPREVQALMRSQERRYRAELGAFEQRASAGPIDSGAESARLAGLYREAAKWLEDRAAGYEVEDHTDATFVERILLEPARAHRERAQGIAARGRADVPSAADLRRDYRRLAALFAVRLSAFERKRFVNLSHAPNKAMNLNSYIGLIGRNFRTVIRPDGASLEQCEANAAQLSVPDADYIITVDADSLLVNDYALRLVHVVEQPGNERLAIVQSPYSAVPGSPKLLERIAGAQTEVQRLISQGSTFWGAAFWVGANALLRRRALEDICETIHERGYPVKRYIQDRTLCEDTESSIDLVARGWQLYNYPDPLSYSATPPDFGTLVIQRRRWASGGLLILPNLFRYLRHTPDLMSRIPEALLRFHYLASLTAVNLGMLLVLTIPFSDKSPTFWLLLVAAPYYTLYGRDLVACGYAALDLPRVYALNLLLIPVNLGGVINSLRQWWIGQAPAFVRTPKVTGRTAAPALYIIAAILIPICAYLVGLWDLVQGRWSYAVFGFFNATLYGYSLARFIGLRPGWEDLVANWRARRAADGATHADPAQPLVANEAD